MKIIKEDNKLKFRYEPYLGNVDWVIDKFKIYENEPIQVAGTFFLKEDDMINIEDGYIDFKIGDLIGDYYKIYKRILGINFDVYLYRKSIIDFKMISCSNNKNLFEFINEIRKSTEDIYIDGPKSTLDFSSLKLLVEQFPNSYEKELYNKARISQVLENYFDNVENYMGKLNTYREKKNFTKFSEGSLYTKYDVLRYEKIIDKLKKMLADEEKYTERQWGIELAQIILILFPKYINYHEQVNVRMTSDVSKKKKEQLDFMLVKSDGCIDVLEIKKASDIFLVSNCCDHDNHYATSSLSKVTMQTEKYLYNIIRDSLNFEEEINKKYESFYKKGFKLKVVNPKGIIIIGKSSLLSTKQLLDLEIIRKMYSNIVDIYTYDDIITMMENILYQIKNKVKTD